MAILNFPASPNINDTYTENGVTYIWTGTYWTANTQAFNDIYVNISGDTMTGNLTVPSLNGGSLAGFRNVIINGNLAINQRGVDIAAAATGDYGQDRWKKTAGGMTQIIEEGNFEPSATYTLSGTGVTTQQLTAPASGNWTLPDIPVTARKIQLEPGPVATPFEHRPIGTELALCQRYYQSKVVQGRRSGGFFYDDSTASGPQLRGRWHFVQTMRNVPTVTFITGITDGIYAGFTPTVDDGWNNVITTDSVPVKAGNFTYTNGSGNAGTFFLTMYADAEL